MTNKQKVNVTIDSNEESQDIEVVELMVLHEEVEEFTIEPLETGDFIVESCLFERKTPEDFASSLQEGRLREQVERMSNADYRPFVMVEGDMSDFSDLDHTQMPPKSLRGMTASIMGRNNIPVVFCSKPEYMADMMIHIARKTIEDVSTVHIEESEAVEEVDFVTKFYMNVDGVGLETAKKLTNQFSTIESALEASEEELRGVDGIGNKLSQTIYNTIHSKSEGVEETETVERTVINI